MSQSGGALTGLLVGLGFWLLSGCISSSSPLTITTRDPAQDQWRIAAYHDREAVFMSQMAEDWTVRAAHYERLFGADSDWMAGARLLAQFYEEAAREQERLASIHTGLAQGQSPSQSGRGSSRSHHRP